MTCASELPVLVYQRKVGLRPLGSSSSTLNIFSVPFKGMPIVKLHVCVSLIEIIKVILCFKIHFYGCRCMVLKGPSSEFLDNVAMLFLEIVICSFSFNFHSTATMHFDVLLIKVVYHDQSLFVFLNDCSCARFTGVR
ncbi:hypothetical protein K501DRAFT_266811 [Backusella circina FSU 941]|nr:hypothetical protein K501DRAFT_268394 [Backusella circina FSU 941]KAI8889638.1 hypothetical protein K501DRAFT_266811 [Backusella circina FSU 941]